MNLGPNRIILVPHKMMRKKEYFSFLKVRQKGAATVVALGVSALLLMIVVPLAIRSQYNHQIASNQHFQKQTDAVAMGGIEEQMLQPDPGERYDPSKFPLQDWKTDGGWGVEAKDYMVVEEEPSVTVTHTAEVETRRVGVSSYVLGTSAGLFDGLVYQHRVSVKEDTTRTNVTKIVVVEVEAFK